MTSNTKKQHTVTRAYLARWAARGQVPVFDMVTGDVWKTNVKDLTAHRYFYSPPDGMQVVEKAIAELEGEWISAQNELLHSSEQQSKGKRGRAPKVLYKRHKVTLAGCLVLQLVRTERVRERFGIANSDNPRQAHVDFMSSPGVIDLARKLHDATWLLGANDPQDTGHALYTSDHPVCVLPQSTEGVSGPHQLQGFIFPLSPTRVLMVYEPKASPYKREWDGRIIEVSQDDVVEYNYLQAGSAERVVISTTDDFRIARNVCAKRRLSKIPA